MSEAETQERRIHPATFWIIGVLIAGGVLVAISYVLQQQKEAKARNNSNWGTGPTQAPLFVNKLEDDLEATNRDGSTVRLGELKGKIWVASYLYSDCPMGCIKNAENLRRVYDEYGDHPNFHMVSFSVNSEGDTHEKVEAFMKREKIDHENWWYLTAEDSRLDDYMSKFFQLPRSKRLTDPEAIKKVGIIEHAFQLILIDHKANVRGYYDLMDTQKVPDVGKTVSELNLGRLLRDIQYILDNEMDS